MRKIDTQTCRKCGKSFSDRIHDVGGHLFEPFKGKEIQDAQDRDNNGPGR
ncbi:MAG: hypothetical protein ABSE80_13225 [Halobacteriota archaeon]